MTAKAILHCTHPVSHLISGSWKTSNGNRNCYFDCLLVPYYNLCSTLTRDELTTSETYRFPWEGPNSVEILGMKD